MLDELEVHRLYNEVLYWFDAGLDRLNDVGLISCHFRALLFGNVELYEAYWIDEFSCKQEDNAIWNEIDLA